jgi:hypothetical protein
MFIKSEVGFSKVITLVIELSGREKSLIPSTSVLGWVTRDAHLCEHLRVGHRGPPTLARPPLLQGDRREEVVERWLPGWGVPHDPPSPVLR